MTNTPTLAETLAVRPEQLTDLTPVEVDRYNAVLWGEFGRLSGEIDKAIDRLFGALLLSKKSVRRGRGYSQVWPISLAEAERMAAEHLETGHEPNQSSRLRYGLTRDGAYAEQLRKTVDRLAALRAEWKALEDGPEAVLDGEFKRRGGWSRMYLCTSDGGHIHRGRQCPSIGPRTELSWLPEVSGMEWREAFKALPRDLSAGSPAIMCTKCYPDAPVEWTVKAADPKECPGSRQYAKLMAPGMMHRVHRWAECHECGKKDVGVTPNGNLRKHDRPEGGEEPKPEAPAPQAPAAPAPKDDNQLVIIERTPLGSAPAVEEKPAPAAKPRPGGTPTVVQVAAHLRRAGFQLSRYTGRMGDVNAGAKVTKGYRHHVISVSWVEDFDSSHKRLSQLGLTDFGKLPAHPQVEQRVRDYAAALAPRYAVEVSGPGPMGSWSLYVSAREDLPARPKGLPSAATVSRALTDHASGLGAHVVDQIDHIRIAINDEYRMESVREALAANGWTFEEPAPAVEHALIYVTGSTPDRPARLRKLRAERERRAAVAKVEEAAQGAPPAVEEAPVPAPAPAAEVLAVAPQEAEEQPAPRTSRCAPNGRRWWQGERVVYKTRDLFLYSGEITGFGEQDGEPTATILMDTRQTAPATRPMYKGDPNRPGKPRPISPAEEWVLPLAKLKPA